MIKLQKLQKPETLNSQATHWTEQLMALVNAGQPIPSALQSRYKQPDVKAQLERETYGKCMYCESKIGHIAYEHIEHIKPKAVGRYPALTFDWNNLGLACPKCNGNKGDSYDEQVPYVNPYVDDPTDFLTAFGALIYHRLGNARGELTEKGLDLNRLQLIEQRKERLDAIRLLFDRHMAEQKPAMKELLRSEIEAELEKDKPYSYCAKSLFAQFFTG